ncbi:hypothetical protein ACFXJ8_25865 [Nonomuraea sp. NPDC059194]|uniref:hypothetical protein n=1 Tax=Nonomuraea sp. NPDC059194 TaxID=3346764 RepID=UPI0036BA97E8
MTLPQVPECSVTRRTDGTYELTHVESGETATARNHEHAHIQGAILRILSSYPNPGQEAA